MRFRYRNSSARSLPHRLPQVLRTGPCFLIITTSTWESVSTAMSGHRGLSQKVTSPTAPDSKRIAASCQTREASFITPYRNHRGHNLAFALRPHRHVPAVPPIRSEVISVLFPTTARSRFILSRRWLQSTEVRFEHGPDGSVANLKAGAREMVGARRQAAVEFR